MGVHFRIPLNWETLEKVQFEQTLSLSPVEYYQRESDKPIWDQGRGRKAGFGSPIRLILLKDSLWQMAFESGSSFSAGESFAEIRVRRHS